MAGQETQELSALLQAVASGRVTPERAVELMSTPDRGPAIREALPPDSGQTLFEIAPTERARKVTEKLPSVRPRRDADTKRDPTGEFEIMDGRYEILREFARGGMGRVLLAVDTTVGREIALKELLPERGGTTRYSASGSSTSANIERFLREARVTGQLEHPNIVPVYEIGVRADGSVYYTMKFVRGDTLGQRLKTINAEHKDDPQTALRKRLELLDSFTQVCNALAFAHDRGVIHRDLKPSNIMVGEFGEVLVLDWGLAKLKDAPNEPEPEPTPKARARAATDSSRTRAVQDTSTVHTMDGTILGTPAYMPPEQANAEEADERSDVYALGAILYEILTGSAPYTGASAAAIVAKVMTQDPTPARDLATHAPPELCALVERAMLRDRDKRLQSAADLAREVKAFRDGRTLSVYSYSSGELVRRFVGRNKAAVSVAAVLVAILAVVGAWSWVSILTEQRRAEDERDRAVAAREEADRNADRAERMGDEATRQAELAEERRSEAHTNLKRAEASLSVAFERAAQTAFGQRRHTDAAMLALRSLQHGDNRPARAQWLDAPYYPTVQLIETQSEEALCMAFSIDGRWFAVGTNESTLLIDRTGQVPQRLLASDAAVYAADFRADGRLAIGTHDGKLRMYDPESGEEVYDLSVGESVRTVAWSPNGRYLAVGLRNGVAWHLDMIDESGSVIEPENSQSAADVAFSPDGRYLAVAAGQAASLYRLPELDRVGQIALDGEHFSRIAFAQFGAVLVGTGWHGRLMIWDTVTQQKLHEVEASPRWINALAVSPCGETIAMGVESHNLMLMDAASAEIRARLPGGVGLIHSLAFDPAGGTVCVSGRAPHVREVNLLPVGGMLRRTLNNFVLCADVSLDGKTLALGLGMGRGVALVDFETLEVRRVLRGLSEPPSSVDFSPDGTLLVSSGDRMLRWRDLDGEAEVLPEHGQVAWMFAYSPDRRRIALVSGSGTFQIRDADTGTILKRYEVDDASIAQLLWSPDGDAVVAVCYDGRVKYVRPDDDAQRRTFETEAEGLMTAVFVGRQLVVGSLEGRVSVWDAATGQRVEGRGHQTTGAVMAMTLSPDGSLLVAGDFEGQLHFLDPGSLELRLRTRLSPEMVHGMCFHPSGNWLVAGTTDLRLHLLDLRRLFDDPVRALATVTEHTGFVLEDFNLVPVPDWRPRHVYTPPQLDLLIRRHRESLQRHTSGEGVDIEAWWNDGRAEQFRHAADAVYYRREYERASTLYGQAQFLRAYQVLNEFVREYPTADVLLLIGRCAAHLEWHERAAGLLILATQAEHGPDFDTGEVWADVVRVKLKLDQTDEAREALDYALEHGYVPTAEDTEAWQDLLSRD